MRIEFPFVEEPANIVPVILRPFARVALINGNNTIVQDMYIDSGADISLIPYSVGIALGFRLETNEMPKKIRGIGGGTISVAIRQAKMKIGENIFDVRIAWCLSEDVPLILGRLDIFDNFRIIIDQRNKISVFDDSI